MNVTPEETCALIRARIDSLENEAADLRRYAVDELARYAAYLTARAKCLADEPDQRIFESQVEIYRAENVVATIAKIDRCRDTAAVLKATLQ